VSANSVEPGLGQVLLTNGVKCEILGIARNPRGTNLWWKPDGTRWAQPPVEPGPLPILHETPPETEYLFYVRWSLPPGLSHESWKVRLVPASIAEIPVGPQGKLAEIENLATVAFTEHTNGFDAVYLFRMVEAPKQIDCHVQMSFAPWSEICVYHLDTGLTQGLVPNAIRRVDHPRYDKRLKALRYDVTHDVSREQYDLRIRARLRSGGSKEVIFHLGHETNRPAVGWVLSPGSESDAEKLKANIQDLVLEQSPWVCGKISGIAMNPLGE
jgi:hypothetical protein